MDEHIWDATSEICLACDEVRSLGTTTECAAVEDAVDINEPAWRIRTQD